MQTAPDNEQAERDRRLLLRLLLLPIRRQSKLARVLSRPYWDGVGAVLGFLSLLVTIILTIYIFNLTTEQGIAHMGYDRSIAYGTTTASIPDQAWVFSRSSPLELAVYVVTDRFTQRIDIPKESLQQLGGAMFQLQHIVTTTNYGPATAQGITVVISSEDEITCKIQETPLTLQTANPTRINQAGKSCEIYYDYFYPRKSSSIVINSVIRSVENGGIAIRLPSVDISGINVAVP